MSRREVDAGSAATPNREANQRGLHRGRSKVWDEQGILRTTTADKVFQDAYEGDQNGTPTGEEEEEEEVNWFIGHLVGDFLLQNDWMALNKKKSSLHCHIHCAVYTLTIWLFTGWDAWSMAVCYIAHFAIDRSDVIDRYMTIIGQERFKTPPMWPWSVIAVDNTFHLLTLFILNATR